MAPTAALIALLAWTGCDSAQPSDEGTLVVEAFLDAERSLPTVRVSRTMALNRSSDEVAANVTDARVELTLNGKGIPYSSNPAEPGYYDSSSREGTIVSGGASYILDVEADDQTARASGVVPPRLEIENFEIELPDRPVEAVFVDTLDIGLDSLDLGLDATQGFIYPVEVTVEWNRLDASESGSEYWIQARVTPVNPFSSTILDFFLRPEQIFREADASAVSDPGFPELSTWSGVYAVPVERMDDPLPPHVLRVSLLRGTDEFARFASSKGDPERREPVTNVTGGIGFVGGISVDSLSIVVEPDTP